MVAQSKPKQGAEMEEETEEEAAYKLSASLKKSHVARIAALFKQEVTFTEHILREAERAALDPCIMLCVYFAVLSHVLNPCARPPAAPCVRPHMPLTRACCLSAVGARAGKVRYRQDGKVVHVTMAILWFLVLGDSGVGKSKVRAPTPLAERPRRLRSAALWTRSCGQKQRIAHASLRTRARRVAASLPAALDSTPHPLHVDGRHTTPHRLTAPLPFPAQQADSRHGLAPTSAAVAGSTRRRRW